MTHLKTELLTYLESQNSPHTIREIATDLYRGNVHCEHCGAETDDFNQFKQQIGNHLQILVDNETVIKHENEHSYNEYEYNE